MSATEAERHEFVELARSQISERFSELLMKNIPPIPERLATKDDIDVLRDDIDALRVATKDDIDALRVATKDDIDALRLAMATKSDLAVFQAEMREQLHTSLAEMRGELHTTLADFRVETRDDTSRQTRLLVLSLVGSVTALAIANTVTATLTH